MSKFYTADGHEVGADDPERLVWVGMCGNWTDDWEYFTGDGIPCCAECGAPGVQATAGHFLDKTRFEDKPEYVEYLASIRGRCRRGIDIDDDYRLFALKKFAMGGNRNAIADGS